MENSILTDYVSEKVYDGLIAGCVPIYLGAPNIHDFIPDNNSIVDYAKLGSPEALRDELERLASDEVAYTTKLVWKTRSSGTWNQGTVQCLQRNTSACAPERSDRDWYVLQFKLNNPQDIILLRLQVWQFRDEECCAGIGRSILDSCCSGSSAHLCSCSAIFSGVSQPTCTPVAPTRCAAVPTRLALQVFND